MKRQASGPVVQAQENLANPDPDTSTSAWMPLSGKASRAD